MPACIKAPLRAPAFVCAGRCISGPGCMCAGAKIFRRPSFQGASKPGTAQPLQNSGAAGRPAHAGARPHPGKNTPLRRAPPVPAAQFPSEGLSAFDPPLPAVCSALCRKRRLFTGRLHRRLAPSGNSVPLHNGPPHKKRRHTFAPALLSFRLFTPRFQRQGYSTSRQSYRKQALHEGIRLNAGFYSNSTVAGGLPVQSYKTRFTCGTSFTMRLAAFASTSQGRGAASAVIKSVVATARRATA